MAQRPADNASLGVGDNARHRAGVAIVGSLVAYTVFTVSTKETPALYLPQPWQDDRFDALVSFDFVALPLLVIIGVLRVPSVRGTAGAARAGMRRGDRPRVGHPGGRVGRGSARGSTWSGTR